MSRTTARARPGTTFPTRLTVIDKRPAGDPGRFPVSPGSAPDEARLIAWTGDHLPLRLPIAPGGRGPGIIAPITTARLVRGYLPRPVARTPVRVVAEPEGVELAYETLDWSPDDSSRITDAIYEAYRLQTIRVPGARPHPTKLVQSAAMASVAPPKPSYRPRLPASIVTDGLLSDAQLETVGQPIGSAKWKNRAGRTHFGTDLLQSRPSQVEA